MDPGHHDHRPDGGGLFAPRSKRSPYAGGLRTPILLRWPGHTRRGTRPDVASAIDIAPTVLRAAGLRPTADMSGTDLLPTAAGRRSLDKRPVFGEIFEHTARRLDEPAVNLQHRGVREGPWKLIRPVTGDAELYRVADDPMETQNLAPARPDIVRRLSRRIDRWWPATPSP